MSEFKDQISVLRQMEKAREAIKRKYESLKSNKLEAEQIAKETFKPIVGPLEKLVDGSKRNESYKVKKEKILPKSEKEEKEHFENQSFNYDLTENSSESNTLENISLNDLRNSTVLTDGDTFHTPESDSLNKYLSMLHKNQITSLDTMSGVCSLKNGPLMIGNRPIYFEDNKIIIDDDAYEQSQGLIELLFKKKPSSLIVTQNDLTNYGEIIKKTNAHKKYYKANEEIRYQPSEKYRDIISKLISKSSPKHGSGFSLPPPYKIARRNDLIDYVYWDDPNELV